MAKTRTAKKANKRKAKTAGAKKKKKAAVAKSKVTAAAKKAAAKKAADKKKAVAKKAAAKKVADKKKAIAKKAADKKKAAAKKAAMLKAAEKKKAAAKRAAEKKVAIEKAKAEAKAKADARKRQASAKSKRGRKSQGPAEVRPLGVLPPSSMKRAKSKPVAHVTFRPRTSPQQPTPPPAQGAQRVTDQDIKQFEERLLEQRQKILREMGHLENNVLKINQRDSSGDLSGYSFHMADAGTDAMEREKAFLFASSEGRALMEINEALRKVYAGEYGVCESCSNPIAVARLEAMPQARLCVSCKEKEEREQRGAV